MARIAGSANFQVFQVVYDETYASFSFSAVSVLIYIDLHSNRLRAQLEVKEVS